jgi:iron(III)-salmochelin esterase
MSLSQSKRWLLNGTALGSLLLLVAGIGLFCKDGCASIDDRDAPVKELTWVYPTSPMGRIDVVVTVPKSASASRKMPVLIALHGQGESRKSPSQGARGWPDDYHMYRAFMRLASPPLYKTDFGDMIDDDRLERFNKSLKARPYRGVIVVCPYLPDDFHQKRMRAKAAAYGDFLLSTVLPRVYKETPAAKTPAATGIDGVSLGGRVAVLVGLNNPTRFGAVGGTQAAFGKKHVEMLTEKVKTARTRNPKLHFRLISSEKDRFRDMTLELSSSLKRAGERHQVDIVKGDHSYAFNRGPGVYEMLLYYDRILRGETLW